MLAPRLVPGGLRFLGGPEFKLGTGEFIGMTNIVHTIHKLKRQDQVALNLSFLSDLNSQASGSVLKEATYSLFVLGTGVASNWSFSIFPYE